MPVIARFRSGRALADATGLDPGTAARLRAGRWGRLTRATLLKLAVLDPSIRPLTRQIFLVCPDCGRREPTTTGMLNTAESRAGAALRRRRDPHLVERRCEKCGPKSALPAAERELFRQELGPQGVAVFDKRAANKKAQAAYRTAQSKVLRRLRRRADPQRTARARARFREYVKRKRTDADRFARTDAHRFAIGRRRVIKGDDLKYELHLCLGRHCGYLTYRKEWHPKCWRRWVSVFAKEHGRPPRQHERPEHITRGRPVRNLKRDYLWLLAHRDGVSLGQLAREAGVSLSVVSEAIEEFVRRLPGRWGIVFSDTAKKGNVARQQLIPLPDELQYLLQQEQQEQKKRDADVRGLHDDGWTPEDISELTGVELPLVRAIIAWHRREGAPGQGTDLAPATPKPARPAPRREEAEGFLVEFLDGGVRLEPDIRTEAQARRIMRDTLRRAKARIKARAFRIAISGRRGGGRWFWAAPGLPERQARQMARAYVKPGAAA